LHIEPRGIPTSRSYTIASTPTRRDWIEITVKREDHGLVSRWLHDELTVGDEIDVEAPNGTFVFTGKEADSLMLIVSVDDTILDAADAVGVFIDNACRSGTCGSCRAKLLSGNVSMAVQDALTEQDKANGNILTCQAKIRGDVIVDV
jgi:ferredoxin